MSAVTELVGTQQIRTTDVKEPIVSTSSVVMGTRFDAIGREKARELVEDIRDDHGYVPPEVFDQMDERTRQIVRRALMKKDEQAGWSIVTLAKNIYSSNARFVFELLQNCDDNHYSRARSRNEDPFVSFKVFSDRIVMTSNEDGFSVDNLRAICSVGKSSKMGAQGYIGEKGIGFKSVFMAAYKVRIQSRDFSFSFQHRKGDLGLGMITPVWEDWDDSVPDELSQFTLYLHEETSISPDDVSLQQRIRQQFHNIHDAILLFMKNMQRIEVAFYDADENEEVSIIHSIEWVSDVEVMVNKIVKDGSGSKTDSNHYLVARHTAQNLSPNENRTYSEEEKSNQAYSRSEIVLAFPLDQESSPLLENQWVFAFLPVRQMGFKFLIQADFVTEASRQDIVTGSPRNRGLGTGIADAFIEAVLQFSKRNSLQWQWMRYIPQKDAYAWDGFWASVIDQIGDRLQKTRLIQLDCAPRLELLSDCSEHRPSVLDKDGNFLLEQFRNYCVSLNYKESDLALLKPYGLNPLTMDDCIQILRNDLASPSSKYKSTEDDDWHSRLANLLHKPFANGWTAEQTSIKQLPIIPIRGNPVSTWVSRAAGLVYYPLVAGDPTQVGPDLCVPGELQISVVEEAATENSERKRLFDAIGVQSASIELVREAIIRKYRVAPASEYGLPTHLYFLYRTHDVAKAPYNYEAIRIFSNYGKALLTSSDMYIRDAEDPYGASELLRTIESDSENTHRKPGLVVDFVNNGYFKNIPERPAASSLTWKDWLHDHLHIRRHPRLVTRDQSKLSEIAHYVAVHRPEKFIGFVQTVWTQEIGKLAEHQKMAVVEQLRGTHVLCADEKKYVMRSTFLPTKELKELCGRFILEQEAYPWLHVETKLDNGPLPPRWLTFSQAIWPVDQITELRSIKFVLDVLGELMKLYKDAKSLPDPQRICRLYIFLQTEIQRSFEPEKCRDLVRDWFDKHDGVYIPESKIDDAAWASPLSCIWESPFALNTRFNLARSYDLAFDSFAANKGPLADFFSKTLDIPDSCWEDYMNEVKLYDLQDHEDFGIVADVYEIIAMEHLEEDEEAKLKAKFRDEAYIAGYDGTKPAWFKSSECLWSSSTRISGMLTLNELYPKLQSFFVKTLGVQKVTPLMVYNKLLRDEMSAEDAKQTILTFNGFLADTKDVKFEAAPLRERPILPVCMQDGSVQLVKSSDEFALLDRQSLGNDFAGKAKILDFSVDDIRALGPFFAWLSLDDRYLSGLVQEITSADVGSTCRIGMPQRRIKSKAHALLSIALAYNSPRTRPNPLALYELLRNSQTLETERITSELRLKQDGKVLKVEKAVATLHIDNTVSDVLKVYVPKNEANQEFCFSSKLPQQFCEWLMTNPTTGVAEKTPADAVSAIKSVLGVKPVALPEVLDFLGIKSADAPLDDDADSDDEHESESETLVPSPSGAGGVGGSGGGGSYFNSSNNYGGRYTKRERDDRVNPELYKALLLKVVDAARRFSFPARGPYDTSALQAALSDGPVPTTTWTPNPLGSAYGRERDLSIGAAGELFVFELLSRLQPELPSFGRANWESNVRHYVRLHPEYQDLNYWAGYETADLTYMDTDSALTTLFIDKGYLDGKIWKGAKIKYFIEVKTSTGACKTPFFVNPRQFDRMQSLSNNNAATRKTNELYVIFRVFNLGRDDCGLRVLVDPESLRQKKKIQFTADPWIVVTD